MSQPTPTPAEIQALAAARDAAERQVEEADATRAQARHALDAAETAFARTLTIRDNAEAALDDARRRA